MRQQEQKAGRATTHCSKGCLPSGNWTFKPFAAMIQRLVQVARKQWVRNWNGRQESLCDGRKKLRKISAASWELGTFVGGPQDSPDGGPRSLHNNHGYNDACSLLLQKVIMGHGHNGTAATAGGRDRPARSWRARATCGSPAHLDSPVRNRAGTPIGSGGGFWEKKAPRPCCTAGWKREKAWLGRARVAFPEIPRAFFASRPSFLPDDADVERLIDEALLPSVLADRRVPSLFVPVHPEATYC